MENLRGNCVPNFLLKKPLLWVGAILFALTFSIIAFATLTLFRNPGQHAISQEISFAQLLQEVDEGKVRNVAIQGQEVQGTYFDGRRFKTFAPSDAALVDQLRDKHVLITRQP
jgi:cell division protease FtsH